MWSPLWWQLAGIRPGDMAGLTRERMARIHGFVERAAKQK